MRRDFTELRLRKYSVYLIINGQARNRSIRDPLVTNGKQLLEIMGNTTPKPRIGRRWLSWPLVDMSCDRNNKRFCML